MERYVEHFEKLSLLNKEMSTIITAVKTSVQNPLDCFQKETIEEMIALNIESMKKLESKFADVGMAVAEIEDTLVAELKNRGGADRLW